MRNLKKKILMAAVLLAFTAGASALGNAADAASLSAKDPSGPISMWAVITASPSSRQTGPAAMLSTEP